MSPRIAPSSPELARFYSARYHWRNAGEERMRYRKATKLAKVRPGSAVLDIGSRDGDLRNYLPPDIKYQGLDIAPEFVRSVAGRDVATKDLEIHPAFAIKDDVVANLAALLGADALAGAPNGSLYGEGLGTALVARLLHRQGGAPPGSGVTVRALSPGDLRRVTAYIDEQLETPLSLQRLADLLGMNLYRFVRAFKESTGVPPYRYVLERRIELSKSLLADSNCPITEVALRTGFASQSHFATAFRRLTSVTPGRYRRDHCHLACSPREAAGSGA